MGSGIDRRGGTPDLFREPDFLPDSLDGYKLRAEFLVNAAGSTNMKTNGAVTPVPFFIKPTRGHVLYLERLELLLTGDSASAANVVEFGSLPALSNGCKARILEEGGDLVYDFTRQTKINTNRVLGLFFARDFRLANYGPGTTAQLWGIWDFCICGRPVVLRDDQYFEWLIQDNLSSGLGAFIIRAVGFEVPNL